MIYYGIAVIFVSYGSVLLWLVYKGWYVLPEIRRNPTQYTKTVSVVIPVRNEEKNIGALLEDLTFQSYPEELFTVIVVNDRSSDGTAMILENYISKLNLKVITVTNESDFLDFTPKKRAISLALSQSDSDWIMTTDGDCRVPKTWIESVMNFQKFSHARFISSPVLMQKGQTFFEKLQQLEWIGLIGMAAIGFFLRKPTLCSGANLAYERTLFEELEGFKGNEMFASGDDEFLLHKAVQKNLQTVHYLKSKEALVYTYPLPEIMMFYYQRKRWASKWKHYQNRSSTALTWIVFVFNVLVIGVYIVALFSMNYFFISLIFVKIISESLFFLPFLKFYNALKLAFFLPILLIFYPVYTLFFGLNSLRKTTYLWKSQELS